MKLSIILTNQTYVLKEGTKTVYVFQDVKTSEITLSAVQSFIESANFFRRIGGTESLLYGYTPAGYQLVKLTSKNPDKSIKVVRTFQYIYE